MKTKYRIISVVLALTFIVGGVYVYYRAIPPKGKATGIVELPGEEIRKIDKVFNLADINNDRLAEIILLKTFSEDMGRLYLLDVKGNLFIGWPEAGKCPAIGDVNNDGYKEIIDILDNKIYVYDQFGVQLSGFPVNLERPCTTPPILADLDNNGALEIICGSNMPMPVINVVDGNGYFLEGWQEKIVMPTAKTGYPFSLAAGDINNDKEVEIVALASDRIFAFNRQGEVIKRSLVLELEENRNDMVTQLILGNFNLDKIPEIVLVYGNELSVRNVDSEPGTSAEVLGELFKIKMENNILSAILGDLNGDNLPEIVLTMPNQKIFVYDNYGKLINGWPRDKVIGTPVVGDINSDGINEVVVIGRPFSDYEISAYDINGKSVNGWPISLMYSVNSTLALGDVDDDRLIEIVFADTEDNIRIIKTNGIVTTGTWPQPSYNIYNNRAWKPEYMEIDKERGIVSKKDVISEASSVIPEFIKPEFRIILFGRDFPEMKKITAPMPAVEKQSAINKEIAKLKDMDPSLIYTIIDPQVEGDKLISYTCEVTNSIGTIKRVVYMRLLYTESGEETGGIEYGLIEVGTLQYRLFRTNKDGRRQIFMAESIKPDYPVLLREIAKTTLIVKNNLPAGIHYLLMYAQASDLIPGENVPDGEKRAAIDAEVANLKRMDPALIYTITEPKFVKGKLIAYTCQATNSIGTINRTVYVEIYYNEAGKETGFTERGKIEDGRRIQYRLAKSNADGNRQIIFFKAYKDEDVPLLMSLARSAIRGIGGNIQDIALLYLPAPPVKKPEEIPAEEKELLINKEITKLKNIDPALIYKITDAGFMRGRLVSYKCKVTNSIGTINRVINGQICYNNIGEEIGFIEYGLIEGGRTQYRLAITNKDGNRQIIFVKAMKEVCGFEMTTEILKKMLGKEKSDTDLIYLLMAICGSDIEKYVKLPVSPAKKQITINFPIYIHKHKKGGAV